MNRLAARMSRCSKRDADFPLPLHFVIWMVILLSLFSQRSICTISFLSALHSSDSSRRKGEESLGWLPMYFLISAF